MISYDVVCSGVMSRYAMRCKSGDILDEALSVAAAAMMLAINTGEKSDDGNRSNKPTTAPAALVDENALTPSLLFLHSAATNAAACDCTARCPDPNCCAINATAPLCFNTTDLFLAGGKKRV